MLNMEIENIHIQIVPEHTVSTYAGDKAHVITDETLISKSLNLKTSLESITSFDRVVMQFTESQYLIGEPRCLFFGGDGTTILNISEISENLPEIVEEIHEYTDALERFVNKDTN